VERFRRASANEYPVKTDIQKIKRRAHKDDDG